MPSFKLYLDERKQNQSGEAPVYLRIIKDRRKTDMSLGYRVRPEDWDEKKQRVKRSHPNSIRLNNLLAKNG